MPPERPSGQTDQSQTAHVVRRIQIWHMTLIVVLGVFLARAFYMQVIRYGYYREAAQSDQLKQYEIPADRGTIKAYMGGTAIPIVLNEHLFTVYADPTFIKEPEKVAATVASVLSGDESKYEKLLKTKDTRYVILAKKVSASQKTKLLGYKYPGIGAQEQDYRTYPQGTLAAQLLGFVTEDGKGEYGLEQALNDELAGAAGEVKATTDASGVPLVATGNNIKTEPQAGDDITLTLDIGIQKQTEQLLEKGVKAAKAPSGSAIVIDPNTGAIKAMANYPSYDPAKYGEVNDYNLFNNAAVSHPIEVGSIMKTLTTAAALDRGVIQKNTSYYDPAQWVVDKFKITNIEEDGGAGTKNIAELLNLSLNTGAVWELMQMGGGQLNRQARDVWYDYMANHYMFGKATGIEQSSEAEGIVPRPENNGAGINLTYANTSFGQGMTATTIQMAATMSAVINGGTYYKPHLVAQATNPNTGKTTTTKPEVVKESVVKPSVSQDLIPLMQYVIDHHSIVPPFDQSKYIVGGKTGTAQVAKPGGGYYDNIFNGTYLGFVGGDKPQYVIAVFINRPNLPSWQYAGTATAQPVFANIAHMLINNAYVTPKTK